jgi:hypothetical protein
MGVSGQRHSPIALYPQENTSDTHCTGSWVGLRAGLDTEARGKILLPGIETRSPDRPVRSQTLYWLSYPTLILYLTLCEVPQRPILYEDNCTLCGHILFIDKMFDVWVWEVSLDEMKG